MRFGSHCPNCVIEPDEQPFEIVFARFLDLVAFHAHVINRELPRLDQFGKIETERRDVTGNLLAVLLEREEHAGFVEEQGAVHQKGEGQQRLAGSGPATDERRPAFRQPAARDLVETTDPSRSLRHHANAR
jgi:hypothetical protein